MATRKSENRSNIKIIRKREEIIIFDLTERRLAEDIEFLLLGRKCRSDISIS